MVEAESPSRGEEPVLLHELEGELTRIVGVHWERPKAEG
jgi:hypothetical protein